MQFRETSLPGAYIVEPDRRVDERGFFARTWCADVYRANGLNPCVAQSSVSLNTRRGTLRGLHYQAAPQEEAKLVRCARGSIFDVIVDLRADSPTYTRWYAVTLTAENGRMLYVPEGCAHGFQTLDDDTEVCYQISVAHAPGLARGIRWDDPTFRIPWPIESPILSDRDRAQPLFERAQPARRAA